MKIGIGISTTPSRKVLSGEKWMKFLPINTFPIVANDTYYQGVALTKNKLLSELDDCDHIFLFDDDCYPIAKDWWKPYTESKEPHLMYQFKLPNRLSTDMRELYRDDKIVSYSHTRGAMIYVERRVLDVVGGMDEAYGKFGFEHPDWTNRIHNAGLTSHRAMDVVGSDKLLYCLDQDGKIESSIDQATRQKNWRSNYELYRKNRNSKEYKAYK